MSGLLLKDLYVLMKQMKIILLMLVILACMPGTSLSAFAVFYAAMLPITALAYDERSKWNELAVMMPYSEINIVLSKYILGIAGVIGAAILSTAAQAVIGAVRLTSLKKEDLLSVVLVAVFSLILLSINLPLMYWLGVEKGRVVFMILICGGTILSMGMKKILVEWFGMLDNVAVFIVPLLLILLAIMLISVIASAYVYKRKKR